MAPAAHTYGLLAAAFPPDDEIGVLRGYRRQRAMRVTSAAPHIPHVQKALEQLHLKLTRVVSDVTGVTGVRIIRAILAGERDPQALAQLRDRRCRHDAATLARALEGPGRAEHLFALRQAGALRDCYHPQLAAGDREIAAVLRTRPRLHAPQDADGGPHRGIDRGLTPSPGMQLLGSAACVTSRGRGTADVCGISAAASTSSMPPNDRG